MPVDFVPPNGEVCFLKISDNIGFVIRPKVDRNSYQRRTQKHEWVWFAPTLFFIPSGHIPGVRQEWIFARLLDADVAVAGIDVGESYGNLKGRNTYTEFFRSITSGFDYIFLSSSPCLLAQSRGGLMLYNWAADNADKVRCIAGIYPVTDVTTWPTNIAQVSEAYGISQGSFLEHLQSENPIDRLKPLADNNVPILHLHGALDRDVPIEKNSTALIKRYVTLGGSASLCTIPGRKHEEAVEFFQSDALAQFLTNGGRAHVNCFPCFGTACGK